jgi:hypothetical protein
VRDLLAADGAQVTGIEGTLGRAPGHALAFVSLPGAAEETWVAVSAHDVDVDYTDRRQRTQITRDGDVYCLYMLGSTAACFSSVDLDRVMARALFELHDA